MDGARTVGHPVEALARSLRGPAFAGCTVLLAVLAHVLAGGPAPDGELVLLLTAVLALLHRATAGTEVSFPRLLLGVTGAQLGLHVALLDHAGHRPSPSALLAHLAAAGLLAAVLRRHELTCRPRRMTALLELAGGGPALPPAVPPRVTPGTRTAVLHPVRTVRTAPHRGPPLPGCPAA